MPYPERRQYRSVEDLLPPFPSLTTDEERERKAESQEPGTYHVIAIPKSFVYLPEYREDDDTTPTFKSAQNSANTLSAPNENSLNDLYGDSLEDLDDPNVVILEVFEDLVRRGPAQFLNNPPNIPGSPTSSQLSIHMEPVLMGQDYPHGCGDLSLPMLDNARSGGRDAHLLDHYRRIISPHIFNTNSNEAEEDLVEIQARTFPPVSKISRSHRSSQPHTS